MIAICADSYITDIFFSCKRVINECTHVIPLFHTGHESPESPRIDFLLIRGGGGGGGGIREVSLKKNSNRDALRVSPDSDTMSLRIFGGIGSIRLESRKNSLRLA